MTVKHYALALLLTQTLPGSPFGGGDGGGVSLAGTNTWTGTQTFSNANAITVASGSFVNLGASDNTFPRITSNATNVTAFLGTGTARNTWILAETTDTTFNFGHGAVSVVPTIFAHTNTQSTTEYTGYNAVGTQSELFKALTESAATSVVQIPVAAGSGTGGTLKYTVFATDGTDHQARTSHIRFAIVNKAGTETCGLTNNAGTADASITELEDGNAVALSIGTLTYAITCATTPVNAVDIQFNAVSSLTQTALRAYYIVFLQGPGFVTPQ